jgi:hypothetical protein
MSRISIFWELLASKSHIQCDVLIGRDLALSARPELERSLHVKKGKLTNCLIEHSRAVSVGDSIEK